MIGVIFTGGTIGSRIGGDGLISTCCENGKYLLIEKYYQNFDMGRSRKFITSAPYTILSEDLTAEYVEKLVKAVNDMMKEDELQGIIVTHGTDSLQYSAAYLYHMLGKTRVPVVLVSSAYVLTDAGENGTANFKAAVDLIEYLGSKDFEEDILEIESSGKNYSDMNSCKPAENCRGNVYVSYMNSDGRCLIHLGNRLLSHDTFSADVYSCFDGYFACDINGRIRLNLDVVQNMPNRDDRTLKFNKNGDKVLFMKMHPNAFYPNSADGIKAVCLESYHSGTICADAAFEKFCSKCIEKNIKIYLTGISKAATQYETVRVYERLHIIPLYDETPISAYCRLMLEPLY